METKEEYERSQSDLTKFIKRADTKEMIGEECVNAILDLQNTLRTKEFKLAGYRRKDIKCGMDACTTSPVESNNNAIKHGPSGINSKMNLNKSITNLLRGINNRYKRRRNHAKRQEYRLNLASRAPTRQFVIPEGQALMDRNFDSRLWCKSTRNTTLNNRLIHRQYNYSYTNIIVAKSAFKALSIGGVVIVVALILIE